MLQAPEVAMISSPDPAAGWRVHDLAAHTYAIDCFTHIDVRRAWALDGELQDLPVSDLAHVIHESSWGGATPAECGHLEPHWSLILEADLSYPIIVTIAPDGVREIVDGRHRIIKAWLLGEECIKARMVAYRELLELVIQIW